MRRFIHIIGLAALLIVVVNSPAAAQKTANGTIAAGGDLGVFFPDAALEKTFTLDGFGEYYLAPNISIRGMFSWASPGFENFTEDHFRQVRLLFNGMYYFEHGKWYPYGTFGAGAYFVRTLLDGVADPDSETRGGINFGLGTEYSLGAGATVKGELRWDVVSQPAGFPDATGVSLTFGYKRYF